MILQDGEPGERFAYEVPFVENRNQNRQRYTARIHPALLRRDDTIGGWRRLSKRLT
jgi:hypothetical protein